MKIPEAGSATLRKSLNLTAVFRSRPFVDGADPNINFIFSVLNPRTGFLFINLTSITEQWEYYAEPVQNCSKKMAPASETSRDHTTENRRCWDTLRSPPPITGQQTLSEAERLGSTAGGRGRYLSVCGRWGARAGQPALCVGQCAVRRTGALGLPYAPLT